jgi:hypothetical protein
MNYDAAPFDTIPLKYKPKQLYDMGDGIEHLNPNNVTIFDMGRSSLFLSKENPRNFDAINQIALDNLQIDSPLSKLFYSDKNVKRIQEMIKKEVYIRSKGQYRLQVDQEVKDVLIAMSGIYKENAVYIPNQNIRQVKYLNSKVIEEIVPGILVNIGFQQKYLHDINNPIGVLPLPMNSNNTGRKTLPSITTIWR